MITCPHNLNPSRTAFSPSRSRQGVLNGSHWVMAVSARSSHCPSVLLQTRGVYWARLKMLAPLSTTSEVGWDGGLVLNHMHVRALLGSPFPVRSRPAHSRCAQVSISVPRERTVPTDGPIPGLTSAIRGPGTSCMKAGRPSEGLSSLEECGDHATPLANLVMAEWVKTTMSMIHGWWWHGAIVAGFACRVFR